MSTGLDSLTRVGAANGGDVVGPASAVNNRIAVFDGTTGKLIKDGGSTIADIVAGSGGLVTSVFGRTGAVVAATNDYTFAQIDKTFSSLADLTTRSAADLSSGTLPAARMPALTGDVTTSAGAVATTITNNAVSLAKLADIATASFLGRNTAGTGDPEVLSVSTAKSMLGLTGTNSGDVTLAGENYLTLAGQVITANPINLSGTHVTSTLPVTKGGTGTATAFTAGSVIFAGAAGVYSQDNASLFFDDTNNRLGIGVTAPQQLLHVKGANPSIRLEDTTASNIGDFTVTSDFIGIGANRNNVTGVRFNTGKTTAAMFMLATNANSAISFGTTPTNNTDPVQRLLIDKDGKVVIGPGTPSQLLEVTGNTFINASVANLFLKDISTGWQVAATTVITPQNNNAIRSTDYTSGLVGWNISAVGNAEFNNVDVRGSIHASIFTFNSIQSTAGTLGVFKSAAKLRSDVVIPVSPTYGTTTVNVDVEDGDGIHAQQFAGNDILRLKGLISGGVGDTWLKVSSVVDNGTWWRYGCIIMAGTNGVTYRAGQGVPDYGLSGQGFIIQTADQTNAPYLQMATHAATFSSQDASGTLLFTPRLRIGNLNGSYGYAADTYGFGAGPYGTAGASWVTVDTTNGVRIGNNTTTRIQLATNGSGFLANSSIAWDTAGNLTVSANANIAGWSITAGRMQSGPTYIASDFDAPPTGAMAWFGQSNAGYRGLGVRDAAGREIDVIANNGSIYPYLQVYDGTRARVVLGGLNLAWGTDGPTNSMGMKVFSSAGARLVEFSDVQNIIAGWSITTTTLSNGGLTIAAGSDPVFVNGTAAGWFGKFASISAFGLYLKGTAGTSANIGIAAGNSSIGTGQKPYIFLHDGTRYRVVIGELNTIEWDGVASASMGFKVWSSSGTKLVEFSDVANTISGWTISSTKIASTGIDILSGASAALAFGTTPPTSAAAGTGIWLDRTGLYGLASNVVQAKVSAADGKITAGAGSVTLDVIGLTLGAGTFAANQVKWRSGSTDLCQMWSGHSSIDGGSTFTNIVTNNLSGDTGQSTIDLGVDGGLSFFNLTKYRSTHATRANHTVAVLSFSAATGSLIIGDSLSSFAALTASAALEIRSTAGALLLPRMTTTQRDALTATDGMLLYNTSTNKVQARAAGAWVDLH